MCEDMTLNEILQMLEHPPDEHRSSISTLPLAHLTSVRSFNEIAENCALKPQHCEVFNLNLLYFSYGGVFHRYGQFPTNEATMLPIAFLFTPRLLERINCFYPYDTGAAYNQKYGRFNEQLQEFDNYRLSNNELYKLTSKFIYYMYGTNKKYLRGQVLSEAEKRISSLLIEPLITLLEFLRADLTNEGVDHRQRAIECHASNSIFLKGEIFKEIIWLGLPETYKPDLYAICERWGGSPVCIPDYDTYEDWRSCRPSEITAILHKMAQDIIRQRYCSSEV